MSLLNNKPLGSNDYLVEQDPNAKKKKLFIIGASVFVLLVALTLMFSGGGPKPGQTEMQATLEPLSEALAITTEYEKRLSYVPTKNDVSTVKTLLRSNYSPLNDLYNTTFSPKKKFSSSPKPSSKSVELLDVAVKNNTIDNEIVIALEAKISEATQNLQKTKVHFTKQESLETIETAEKDLSAALDILNRAR